MILYLFVKLLDFYLSPHVKYKLHEGMTMSICLVCHLIFDALNNAWHVAGFQYIFVEWTNEQANITFDW